MLYQKLQSFDYKPFGDTLNAGEKSRIGYAAQERDEKSRYFAMGTRQYDPLSGSFLSVDPFYESFPDKTSYHYCNNNPICFKDPSGLSPEGEKGKEDEVQVVVYPEWVFIIDNSIHEFAEDVRQGWKLMSMLQVDRYWKMMNSFDPEPMSWSWAENHCGGGTDGGGVESPKGENSGARAGRTDEINRIIGNIQEDKDYRRMLEHTNNTGNEAGSYIFETLINGYCFLEGFTASNSSKNVELGRTLTEKIDKKYWNTANYKLIGAIHTHDINVIFSAGDVGSLWDLMYAFQNNTNFDPSSLSIFLHTPDNNIYTIQITDEWSFRSWCAEHSEDLENNTMLWDYNAESFSKYIKENNVGLTLYFCEFFSYINVRSYYKTKKM